MTPADGTFPDAELDELSRRIYENARAAYLQFLTLVDDGMAPQEAIRRVMTEFDQKYYEQLAGAFSAVLDGAWAGHQVRSYLVGSLPLSARLYRAHREVAEEAAAIIREHLKGVQMARQLALALYEGYGYRGVEPLKVIAGQFRTLPIALRRLAQEPGVRATIMQTARRAAAGQLRSTALRSAYLQAFDAAIAGAARPRLERLLRVAVEEKSRYFANRIAQTELARAHSNAVAAELMADATIEVVQIRLSGAHPRADICDIITRVDKYGLGPGCYPKKLAPKPTFHPFCRCRARSRPDLAAAQAKLQAGAEVEYLQALSAPEAARLLGSKARAAQVMKGRSALDVWNDGQPDAYAVQRMGAVATGRRAAR